MNSIQNRLNRLMNMTMKTKSELMLNPEKIRLPRRPSCPASPGQAGCGGNASVVTSGADRASGIDA